MSRAWRDITARIKAGYGHHPESPVEPGTLAIFCPTCPQPGINLPNDWKNDRRRLSIIHSLCSCAEFFVPAGYISGAL